MDSIGKPERLADLLELVQVRPRHVRIGGDDKLIMRKDRRIVPIETAV
jgi:hypothetical protein